MFWLVVLPIRPLSCTVPEKLVTTFWFASLAVRVAGNGVPANCGPEMLPQINDATAPAWTTNELLEADAPPLLIAIRTAGSATVSVTFPVHTPAENVAVVGVIGRLPACPEALSVPAPA